MSNWDRVESVGNEKHGKKEDKFIQYGTAGFRTKANLLDHVMYRMGVLAVLRSKYKKGETIGVMITASHNPEEDNGVKLVDPTGEMLEQSWEGLATNLANAENGKLGQVLDSIVKDYAIDLSVDASVFVGRDTRSSSPALSVAVIDGINAVSGVKFVDYGVVSTPILHYLVVCRNTDENYGKCSEEGYFDKLYRSFKALRPPIDQRGNYKASIKFDGANGVGADKMKIFAEKYLRDEDLKVEILNGGEGKLNFQCGADFVKTSQKPSNGLEKFVEERCVAFDGDADRVIYFYVDSQSGFRLLDGDRIATLIAGYVSELLKESGLDGKFKLGIVQTAYANGSSTDYIANHLKVAVACAKTGVKNLHHLAKDFDIGVYFEANGHGTIIFSPQFEAAVPKDSKLKHFVDLVNQTVGDALSDALVVETILGVRGWSAKDWFGAYSDLPNRLIKVRVADRNVITTTDAERQCVSPDGLQDKINELVAKFPKGRSFVRPSGTEDVVRVYAEADTQENCDQLIYEVGLAVHSMAGGVGEPTPKPN